MGAVREGGNGPALLALLLGVVVARSAATSFSYSSQPFALPIVTASLPVVPLALPAAVEGALAAAARVMLGRRVLAAAAGAGSVGWRVAAVELGCAGSHGFTIHNSSLKCQMMD